jgi:hypothetical protein
MRQERSLGFTTLFGWLEVTMDHRVKPGGDECGNGLLAAAKPRSPDAVGREMPHR